MSEQTASQTDIEQAAPEQMQAALFAHLVVQQSNMALMLLGKVPHPETGQTVQDLEAAKLFIDMLEMLEAKTKGNLSKEESAMLKQALMGLRMAYVEAVQAGPAEPKDQPTKQEPAASASEQKSEPPGAPTISAEEEEHKKKFSKKY